MPDLPDPLDTLKKYMAEMREWEIACAKKYRKLPYAEETRVSEEHHLAIFDKYCSKKRARPEKTSYSIPPDWDPDREAITFTKVGRTIAEIHSQQEYGRQLLRIFRFALEKGEWKLFEMICVVGDEKIKAEL